MSRREFLAAANAAAFLLMLESCSLGPIGRSVASPAAVSGNIIKQALLELQAALRASPDHLAFRAADVVLTKDATKIVDFVRDSIGVVPPWGDSNDLGAVRWGSAATLRGGQGTLRERADILAGLLTKAGFTATVKAANRPSSIGVSELYRQRVPAFNPSKGKVDAARSLLRRAGLPAAQAQQAFDAGPDPVAAILGAMPADIAKARVRSDLLPSTVPVVEFEDAGKKRYAFAVGALGIGDAPPAGLRSAGATEDTPVASVTVSALANPAPGSKTGTGQLIDLVSGTWRADKLVGRQLLLTFAPPQGPKAIIDAGLDALPVRIPLLRVQTDAPPAEASAETSLTVSGAVITVHGDVLTPANPPPLAAGAPLPGPYGAIQSLSDSDRATAQSRVASIKVSANASAFPDIELLMDASDSSGASVDGLDSRSFTIKEQGTALDAFTVYSNTRTQQRPRVLFVYDSYPEWFSSPAAKSKFDSDLATAIVAKASSKAFDLQVVGLAQAPDPQAWAAPSATQLAAAFGHGSEAADDPWASVGGAALDQGVTAFVVISDFSNTDSDPNRRPTYQHRLVSSHVPVYAVPFKSGQENPQVAADVVAISGGATFDHNDPNAPSAIAAAVGMAVGPWFSSAYRIRYRAGTAGPSTRTVAVGVNGRAQLQGTATYQVPDKPLPPPSFVGLYVRIEMAGLQTVRRLAGLEISDRGAPYGDIGDPGAVAETRAAINGVTTIAIEPGSPTSSALLDDVVSGLLTLDPIAALPATATTDQLLKAAPKGIRRVPVTLAALLRPTHVDPLGLAGLKVLILQDRAPNSATLEQHADLAIGVNPVIPLTSDPVAAFKAAVATSVAACAAEAATFPDSAYQRLGGVALMVLKANDYGARDAWLAGLTADVAAMWRPTILAYDDYHRLVPKDGKVQALWVVDPDSGVSKAVLLDGTGGAMLRQACHFDATDQLALSIAFIAVLCSFGLPFPFFCLGINALAVALAVASYFKGEGGKRHNDIGTPFGIGLPFAGLGGAGFGGLEGGIGIVLILVTIQNACSGEG